MKYLFLFLLFLTSCHPRFHREEAKALLEVRFNHVDVRDYDAYSSADCFDNRKRSFIWSAQDNKGMPANGVLCCDSKFSCLVFEKNP